MNKINYKWVVLILIIGLSTFYLLPEIGGLTLSLKTLGQANFGWLFLALLATITTFFMSTYVVLGSTFKPLPFKLTLVLQLATTVVSRITPKGVGAVALIEQYLERSGLSRSAATISTTMIYAVGAIVHIILLVSVILLVDYGDIDVWSGNQNYIHIFIGILVLLSFLALLYKAKSNLIKQWLTELVKTIRVGLKHPKNIAQLFLGSAGITLSYTLAFYFSLQAFSSAVPFGIVFLVYLAGAALSSAAPTPGGLGALEAALVIGLAAADISLEQAVAGVLVFRLLTFWLPILPGFIALRYINKTVFTSR